MGHKLEVLDGLGGKIHQTWNIRVGGRGRGQSLSEHTPKSTTESLSPMSASTSACTEGLGDDVIIQVAATATVCSRL